MTLTVRNVLMRVRYRTCGYTVVRLVEALCYTVVRLVEALCYTVVRLVEALCYNSEGSGFNS